MGNVRLGRILRQIGKLVAAESAQAQSDRELLARFIDHRDEAAFAALVHRHGPMTLGVCRRVLRHTHNAEDACQAAFLLLARKAASIRKQEALGSWLHGVAFRVASNLKRDLLRRRVHEARAADLPSTDAADITWREVRAVLDAEVSRLPATLRAPIILCYLEGRTRDEAARELGWSLSVVRGRLERGRERLRERLSCRGLTLPAVLLASLLVEQAAEAALPVALVVKVVQAAARIAAGHALPPELAPNHIVSLMEGVSEAMSATRATTATIVVLSLLGLGVSAVALSALSAQQPPPAASKPAGETPFAPERVALAGTDEEGADTSEQSRNQTQSRLNLKKIALALHNYAAANGHFPAPAIYAGDQPSGAGAGPMRPGPSGPPAAGLRGPGAGKGSGSGGAGLGGPHGPGPGGQGPVGVSGLGGSGSPGSADGAGPPAPGGPGFGGAGAGFPGPGEGTGGGPALGGGSSVGSKGKALLSWRVAILPYLEQDHLYQQFRLNEPWDSPHNKQLLGSMPKEFAAPGVTPREPNATFYQVFVGPRAGFEKHRALGFADFLDGTSNTLLVVEAGSAVPWTKPEDLHFALDEPIPELGGLFASSFNAALADGSVFAFSKKWDPETLRRAIMRDDSEVVDLSAMRVATSRKETELRRQNERIKQELQREQHKLEELRREKELLQEVAEDAETKQLRIENERLEQHLRQSRKDIEQLQEEIRRLRQSGTKQPEKRVKP